MNQILTDEEVSVITGIGFEATGRAIEQAILNKLSGQEPVSQVTCQIYGHVVGACDECNTHTEKDVNETNKRLADNYLKLTCGIAPSVPEGYVLVPIEPTVNQIVAGQDSGSIENSKRIVRIYKAMLSAARSE